MCGIACLLTTPTLDHCTHLRSLLIESIYQNFLKAVLFLFLWYLCLFDLYFVSYIALLLV